MPTPLLERFNQLDKALIACQHLWRIEPFHHSACNDLPWSNAPQLCEFLSHLDLEQIEFFKANNDQLVTALCEFIPELEPLWSHCALPSFTSDLVEDSQQLSVGIPGRKWQQIRTMGVAALQAGQTHRTWLEWCSGKGYLGQWLAQQSFKPVVSFEWQAELCESGQALADKHQLPMTFIQGDALSPDCQHVFQADQHAVALHACGDLHAHLIEHVCDFELEGATISPCCYHLIQAEHYQALSSAGKRSLLSLSKADLRIPLQETVTGGERVRRHRQLEMSYRLGLDALLKAQFADNQYRPIPSIKKSLLSDGFAAFCRWAQQQKGWDFPLIDLDDWYQLGCSRFVMMERLSLVQQVFRRPLEMWLVCDKALRLEQAGYNVSLMTFCERDITPRNILIQAVKK